VGEYPANDSDPSPLGDALHYTVPVALNTSLCLGVGRVVDRVTRVQVITIESESPMLHYTSSRVHIRPTYLSDGRRMSARTLEDTFHPRACSINKCSAEREMYMIHEHLFRKCCASAFVLASSCPVVRQGLMMSDEPLSPASPLDKFSRVGRRHY
jgi:hypothetical protein